ncbi:hypothetical protein [Nocardioides dongkuii]|uniref:hypothetical protein n=1 Tax=Nocardioides dongkuii TaxID=2760089 RepID=UPI0015F90C61|nr:hypothetical protein [Nocardioides dongkuii]
MRSHVSQVARALAAWLAYGLAAALVVLPVAVVWALQDASFEDRLGAFPVEVSLAHNGVSTLDTGILGELYWERTGTAGLGASIRSTGPPEAGGTLSSYVSPEFLRANAAFVDDPSEVARAYGHELRSEVLGRLLRAEVVAAVVLGGLLALAFRGRPPPVPASQRSPGRRVALTAAGLVAATGVSTFVAVQGFQAWDGNREIEAGYPMPGVEGLSFSSAQTVEVAQQVQPFIEKNTERIRADARRYEATATEALEDALPLHDLAPREGERVVLAEADPQGSLVGTRVRRALYPMLAEELGEDATTVRTISGDISSNGTVAEEGFVRGEAAASPDVPTVAVKGDHDSETTVTQLEENDVQVPDLEVVDVDGLLLAGAADPAFKALFGGLVTNDSGREEDEVGADLREVVDAEVEDGEGVLALLHQPRAVAGYLGVASTAELTVTEGRETTPWDDGVPDAPPGGVNIGHLHDAEGPWVLWNTGEDPDDLVTWTVVSQLGTSGGVEETPTFNRFSTPFSVPLKTVSVQLQYVDADTGLHTGWAGIDISPEGAVTITDRIDLGLPGGEPLTREELGLP